MQNTIHSVSEIKKDGDLFLICGGDLKGQNLSLMDGEIMSVSKVFIFGKDKHLIASQMKSYVPCTCIEDLDEAVLEVSKIARKMTLYCFHQLVQARICLKIMRKEEIDSKIGLFRKCIGLGSLTILIFLN